MTNEQQKASGFRAGVKAHQEQTPYELKKTVLRLAFETQTPYIIGFQEGVKAAMAGKVPTLPNAS